MCGLADRSEHSVLPGHVRTHRSTRGRLGHGQEAVAHASLAVSIALAGIPAESSPQVLYDLCQQQETL